MSLKHFNFIILAAIVQTTVSAQDTSPIAFGDIKASDFIVSSPLIDTGTGGVVLADIGSADIIGYEGAFKIVFKRYTRIKILNKNGYDAAKITIRFSAGDNESRTLKSLQAATYNLENGKVVSTPADETDALLENNGKDLLKETFIFPHVKEGSIIELTYSLKSSSFFHLRPWFFQEEYPVLWSKYSVSMPDIFDYACTLQGHHKLYRRTSEDGKESVVPLPGWSRAFLVKAEWIMKEVPAIKEEPFTFNLDNHIAGIHFQLNKRPISPVQSETVLGTWVSVTNRLLQSPLFGQPLSEPNHWLKSDLKKITAGCSNDTAKARRVFAYLRDNFLAAGYDVTLNNGNSLKDIFKKRSGSTADINLLLIAMLREEDIKADPVLLSTRENGVADSTYPLMDNYNYVVCRMTAGDEVFYLDASRPKIGFGRLPAECYNGYARGISQTPSAVYLRPDSLHEYESTNIALSNDPKGGGMTGYYTFTPGYYTSFKLRNRLINIRQDDFFKEVGNTYPYPVKLDSAAIDSLADYDMPVAIHYRFKFRPDSNGVIYFNPILPRGMKENPFKSIKREYPVEMPYTSDEVYTLTMEVPEGYKIDELPGQAKFDLDKGDGTFEYTIAVSGNTIQFRTRIVLKKAIFAPAAYASIRDFFGNIVKKENEFIVFKRL